MDAKIDVAKVERLANDLIQSMGPVAAFRALLSCVEKRGGGRVLDGAAAYLGSVLSMVFDPAGLRSFIDERGEMIAGDPTISRLIHSLSLALCHRIDEQCPQSELDEEELGALLLAIARRLAPDVVAAYHLLARCVEKLRRSAPAPAMTM